MKTHLVKLVSFGEELSMNSLNAYLLKCAGVIGVFLAPIKMVLFAVGFLIVADFISGVWAAKRRGEKITSNGFRHTVTKMFAYQGTIITAFVVESFLLPDVPFVKIVSAMIGLTEVKSFFENMNSIVGLDVWSELLKKVHGNKTFIRKKSRRRSK